MKTWAIWFQSPRPSPLLWAPPTGCHRLTSWTLGWGTCREGDNNLFYASSAPWPIMNAVWGVVLHIIVFSPEVGPVIIPVLQRRMLRFKEKECNLLKAMQLTLGSRLSDSTVLKLPLMNSTALTSQASHFLYSDSCPPPPPPTKRHLSNRKTRSKRFQVGS